jgi:hypothetical protein
MLQANRDNPNLTEPLLKILTIFDSNMQEQASCADVLNLLRQHVSRYQAPEHSSLIKVIVICYKRCQEFYSQAKAEQKDLIKDMAAQLLEVKAINP